MDAQPPCERPAEFITVTEYLTQLGARVPQIHAADRNSGLVLIEDLGRDTFTQLLDHGHSAEALYTLAIRELVKLQTQCQASPVTLHLPSYNEAAALQEVSLFVEWYVPERLGHPLKPAYRDEFEDIFSRMYQKLPPLDPVLVHRDFHVDNLLLVNDRCAMIDYQDAVLGSPVYDLVSLVEDARRDVDSKIQSQIITYWQRHLKLPFDVFRQHYAFWGAQRHCKVAGIFIRLWHRDGKQGYLKHLQRVMRLLRGQLEADDGLLPLRNWMEHVLPSE